MSRGLSSVRVGVRAVEGGAREEGEPGESLRAVFDAEERRAVSEIRRRKREGEPMTTNLSEEKRNHLDTREKFATDFRNLPYRNKS